MKSPAYQFYPADYLASQRVQLLTLEEEGAYARLMAYCWLNGSIPSDPDLAARLVGKGCSTNLARLVQGMFVVSSDPTKMIHERMERERQKQAKWRQKCSKGGQNSAESKKKLKGSTKVTTKVTSTLQSSSSSSDNICAITAEDIYREYPLKKGRPVAIKAIERAMKKIDPTKLLELTKAYAACRNGDLEFMPMPSTWFNGERYNDDPSTWPNRINQLHKNGSPHKPTSVWDINAATCT